MKRVIILICIIALLFVSQAMLYLFPLYGLIITVLIAVLFLFFAVYDIYDLAAEELFAYASILPLLSLFSFSLPWLIGLPHQIVFYFLLLLASELFYSFLPIKHKIYHIRSMAWLPLVIFIGGITGLIFTFFLPHASTPLLWGLLIILISSISEALYFQGLIQNASTFLTDKVLGVLFTVFIYGFFHITTSLNNLGYILIYMLIGSVIYAIWKNIYLNIIFYLVFQLIFFLITNNLFLQ
jgi:hypothetical protein